MRTPRSCERVACSGKNAFTDNGAMVLLRGSCTAVSNQVSLRIARLRCKLQESSPSCLPSLHPQHSELASSFSSSSKRIHKQLLSLASILYSNQRKTNKSWARGPVPLLPDNNGRARKVEGCEARQKPQLPELPAPRLPQHATNLPKLIPFPKPRASWHSLAASLKAVELCSLVAAQQSLVTWTLVPPVPLVLFVHMAR